MGDTSTGETGTGETGTGDARSRGVTDGTGGNGTGRRAGRAGPRTPVSSGGGRPPPDGATGGAPRAAPRPSASQALGRYGEDLAERHLTASGMAVLARNWRCAQGEIDLVARDRDGTVVFVEVKTRAGTGFGEPAEAVGRVKARRLRVLACLWLLENRPPGAPELRFDVVGVVRRRGEQPSLTHLRGAF